MAIRSLHGLSANFTLTPPLFKPPRHGPEPIEAKTIELPIVVEAIGAKTSYKHCIDNIGASISLVYAKNWQNILHVLVKL